MKMEKRSVSLGYLEDISFQATRLPGIGEGKVKEKRGKRRTIELITPQRIQQCHEHGQYDVHDLITGGDDSRARQ
ncbi:hypothetical protein NUU61_008609 [Penicillium alfredii]|uniref:Uncharacterized protein n=1 Tax=Penicillium alfredii TaxID=1506179 RepID=A0A9W9JWG8_9EURO|nr:uncharacterized protein NUU61_008609 [Penicillium alfredii]KAJ5084030.1 hypothetical protein NUU61_008609 [Penicillium alfredii]